MTSEELSSISPRSTACLAIFSHLEFLLHKSPESLDKLGFTFSSICNELARFKIWASSIGALQPTESALSLARRLKNAPRAASQVVDLLTDMEDTLKDGENQLRHIR